MPFDSRLRPDPAPAVATPSTRPVAIWLLIVAAMILVMISIGGATRLTGSGLSIMEWAPLMGTLPPLSEAEWQRLYDLYRTIPQYELVNAGFGMEGFRRIFWLEWIHRLWGRLIGLAFALPLAWFWWRGRLPPRMGGRLALLLLLGAAQGGVGWFMVASGFEPDRTAVSPYRLVAHLGLAFLLFGAMLWVAFGVLWPRPAPGAPRPGLRGAVLATTILAVATMLAGGFVAGLHAGLTYNTFPLMDGALVPEGYGALTPFWLNAFENVAAVQFNHRLLATATLAGGLVVALLARGHRTALLLAAAVAVQYGLGIATLLLVVPATLGTLHQTVAALVLAAGLLALHRLRGAAA